MGDYFTESCPVNLLLWFILNKHSHFHFILSKILGYLYVLIGMFLAIIVQTASAAQSIITPLCGLGIVSTMRAYEITIGSCMGKFYKTMY